LAIGKGNFASLCVALTSEAKSGEKESGEKESGEPEMKPTREVEESSVSI
jgi:hypothetical protein